MIVRDILKLKGNALFTVGPEAPLSQAVSIMVRNDIGSVMVVEEGRMAGKVTFRDVLSCLDTRGGSLGNAAVGDAMVRDPAVVGPDDTLDQVLGIMTARHVRYLPVMDGDKLLGVISYFDVAKASLTEAASENRLLRRYIESQPK
ncbi:MAG TPA: CBS domain-containing protein [Burkholderiales bacterium]|nr:CBS domain-containing protein [Burkholderiales bacterium]